MARVFMSFLGTSPYTKARYRLKGILSPATHFVQEALIRLLCRRWDENDRFVFFLTPEARKKNWEDGRNFPEGLKTRLQKIALKPQICDIAFTEGSSEEEIMQNFLTVVNSLEENDEVIFDITHSFRSLPMLNLVALNYARVLKNICLRGIYYGAFETLGSPQDAQKIPLENRIVPIFDLTPYTILLDWSFAVEELLRYGLAERLTDLIDQETKPVLKETRGQDQKASFLRKFSKHLRELTLNIYTCRCPAIEKTNVGTIFSDGLAFEDFLPPFAPLFELIGKKMENFSAETPWEKAKAAVEWCLEHKLIQQGYTILQEAIISEVIRLIDLEGLLEDEKRQDHTLCQKNRSFTSSLLSMMAQKKAPDYWRGELAQRKDKALELQKRWGENLEQIAIVFHKLAEFRNDINHCGCRESRRNFGDIYEGLEKCYKDACNRDCPPVCVNFIIAGPRRELLSGRISEASP